MLLVFIVVSYFLKNRAKILVTAIVQIKNTYVDMSRNYNTNAMFQKSIVSPK